MSYHFNPATGKSAVCTARVRQCPLAHGETPEAARAVFESSVTSFPKSTTKRPTATQLQELPAEVLRTTPLKELDAAQLAQTLRHEAVLLGMDMKAVDSSIDLASILHAHQARGNRGDHDTTPYIEHPLRNSLRLVRMGVKEQEVIIASILHDTVEDGAQKFAEKFHGKSELEELEARELLRQHIKVAYGSRVLSTVDAVTNEHLTRRELGALSLEERHGRYKTHVVEHVLSNPDAFLVKLSDFFDNAASLPYDATPERLKRVKKQATKYTPIVPLMQEALAKLELPLTTARKQAIHDKLSSTAKKLQEIIERPEPTSN